jgi:hypothetical protein
MHPTALVEVAGVRRRVDWVPLEADLCSDTRLLPLVEILAEAAGPASAGCAIQLGLIY